MKGHTPQRVFIGTAGWGIPRANAPDFDGEGSVLSRYARTMNATEINTTFYRRHRAATFERWRESTPDGFRFSVKLPRAITHDAALVGAAQPLRDFFDDVAGLREKLGPILVQLPPSAVLEPRRAHAFFAALRSLYEGNVACEPRHASWYSSSAAEMLARYDDARVVADPPRPRDARRPAGSTSLIYHRLHGSPRIYWSRYDRARLSALADEIRTTSAATHWCIFDNTASGVALANALELAASALRLASDAVARQGGDAERWPEKTSRRGHLTEVMGTVHIGLLTGDPWPAWKLMLAHWEDLKGAMITSLEFYRSWVRHGRARVALAAAETGRTVDGWTPKRLLADVRKTAREMAKDKRPFGPPWTGLIDAALAHVDGDRARAKTLLGQAIDGFDRAGMALYREAARWRLGDLTGVASVRAQADAWMRAQEVPDPKTLVDALVPGFGRR